MLTKNLTATSTGSKVTLSPERHVLITGKTRIVLKEDLAHYGLVHLKPGETTYIRNPNTGTDSLTIKYKISEEWGNLHGLWTGTIEASLAIAK